MSEDETTARAHECGRTGTRWSVFNVAHCMGCAVQAASYPENSGWTPGKLARAIAQIRVDGLYLDGRAPDPQDIERADKAFALASELPS